MKSENPIKIFGIQLLKVDLKLRTQTRDQYKYEEISLPPAVPLDFGRLPE